MTNKGKQPLKKKTSRKSTGESSGSSSQSCSLNTSPTTSIPTSTDPTAATLIAGASTANHLSNTEFNNTHVPSDAGGASGVSDGGTASNSVPTQNGISITVAFPRVNYQELPSINLPSSLPHSHASSAGPGSSAEASLHLPNPDETDAAMDRATASDG